LDISACTAYTSEKQKKEAFDSGMSYFLTKPVDIKKLEVILEDVFL